MKIASDTVVELEYELMDSEGTVVDTTSEDGAVTYIHGYGQILEGLESALSGRTAGDDFTVTLDPENAFGDHDAEGIVAVPRAEFPADAEIVPGDWVSVSASLENEEGEEEEEIEMRVIEIRPDSIFLDANHPLAGQQVSFNVRVVTVRAATAEELEASRRGEYGVE